MEPQCLPAPVCIAVWYTKLQEVGKDNKRVAAVEKRETVFPVFCVLVVALLDLPRERIHHFAGVVANQRACDFSFSHLEHPHAWLCEKAILRENHRVFGIIRRGGIVETLHEGPREELRVLQEDSHSPPRCRPSFESA